MNPPEPLIAPLSIGERLGCLIMLLVGLSCWLLPIWAALEYGRKQGCRTDAEVVAPLQALHQPSVEVQP